MVKDDCFPDFSGSEGVEIQNEWLKLQRNLPGDLRPSAKEDLSFPGFAGPGQTDPEAF